MANATKSNTVVIADGSVEYDITDAAILIEDMIDALKAAQEDGAEYVVALSGNNRGARYVRAQGMGDLDLVEDVL